MPEDLTLQTAAAFERIHQSLLGKTDDDLKILMYHLNQLSEKAKEIYNVSAATQIGEFD